MSREEFSDECQGCRPAMLDVKTGKVLPPDNPMMVAANNVWDHQTTLEERQAYHRVCCLNSRDPDDLHLAGAIVERLKAALAEFN